MSSKSDIEWDKSGYPCLILVTNELSEQQIIQTSLTRFTHLGFADDIILCCKGDFRSIYLMMRDFKAQTT